MSKKLLQTVLLLVSLHFSCQAGATLIDRGSGLIYDSVQNITFLQDAKAAGAAMTFDDAYGWAQNLVFGGFDDWRLPHFFNECPPTGEFDPPGYNCSGSELSRLYYEELGNRSIFEGGPSNLGPFANVLGVDPYSIYHLQRTDFDPPAAGTYFFVFDTGRLGGEPRGFTGYAWAVREGDVASVPEPGTIGLLAMGLFGVAGLTRRRRLPAKAGGPLTA